MQYLIDTSPNKMTALAEKPIVAGQLCTPLTNYRNWGGKFGLDNGACSGLDRDAWFRLLAKHLPFLDNCMFVALPDVVGNARRTMELFNVFSQDERVEQYSGKLAMVMQDGIESMDIPWIDIDSIFIGGSDSFKDSNACYDIVRAAKALALHVHVGRVNQIKRFRIYDELGADTCDGSSIAMFDYKLENIENSLTIPPHPTFFEQESFNDHA